jgi:RNA polymerase sigma-70 factor (ECF subfamily)
MGDPSDEWEQLKQLMLLAQEGDRSAYNLFLHRILPRVRGFVRKYCSAQSAQDDLVQEILLALHAGRHSYRADRPLRPWLYAIMKYRLIDTLRSRRREISPELVQAAESVGNDDSMELRSDLRKALSALSGPQQRLIQLAKVEGHPLSTVSRFLESTEGATRVALHRVIRLLRSKLE